MGGIVSQVDAGIRGSQEGRASRRGPLVAVRWLALAGALLALGLGLRLTTLDRITIHLDDWMPWLTRPAVVLYFFDSEERFLVPVTRRVPSEEATPAGAARELLRAPQGRAKLAAPFPMGASLSLLEVQDGMALVEVTAEGTDTAAFSGSLATRALSRTLQEFPGIESVRLVVNGMAAGQTSSPRAEATSHPIYYTHGPLLVPVEAGANSPRQALDRYLAGPRPAGLEGLPEDVRLLEYRFDASRGLAYVNFAYTPSVRRLALDDPYRIRRTLTGIIATLTEYREVQAVMLGFQGQARLGLGECADLLRAPQVRPRALNDEAVLSGL
ncbi:MAG: GerMN domain-containing protein [Dehalococcoidia bacterium]|nr:GerMN domain-containing protein [Dehalococcoidia bacterium]